MEHSGCHITIGGWFVSVLTIIFVLAKLFNIVNWSWWIVFSPLWVSFLLTMVVMIALVIVYIWIQW